MQFDRLDQSFLNHATLLEQQGAACAELDAGPTTACESANKKATRGTASGDTQQQGDSTQLEMSEESDLDDVLAMLLTAVPEQWEMLVDRIVDALSLIHI